MTPLDLTALAREWGKKHIVRWLADDTGEFTAEAMLDDLAAEMEKIATLSRTAGLEEALKLCRTQRCLEPAVDRGVHDCMRAIAEALNAQALGALASSDPAPGDQVAEAERAPWCKDALFLITVHGDGAAALLVRGWSALCHEIVAAHYFEPNAEQRAEVLSRVTAWGDWQNVDTGPYFLALDYEDGSVSITRVTDARALSQPKPEQGERG